MPLRRDHFTETTVWVSEHLPHWGNTEKASCHGQSPSFHTISVQAYLWFQFPTPPENENHVFKNNLCLSFFPVPHRHLDLSWPWWPFWPELTQSSSFYTCYPQLTWLCILVLQSSCGSPTCRQWHRRIRLPHEPEKKALLRNDQKHETKRRSSNHKTEIRPIVNKVAIRVYRIWFR